MYSLMKNDYYSKLSGFKGEGETEFRDFINDQNVKISANEIRHYHPLLKRMTDKGVNLFLPLCTVIKLVKDQLLYKQGDASSQSVFLILHGQMELFELQTKERFGVLYHGDSLGEESLIDDSTLTRKTR